MHRHCAGQDRRHSQRGRVVAIRQQFELPVKYIGVGEKAEDLALFNPDKFVDDLLAEGYDE